VVDMLQVLEGLAYVGFIAGAIFAVIELRSLSKSRKTELMVQFNEHWSSKEFEEAFCKIRELDTKDPREMEKKCGTVALWMTVDYIDGIADLAYDKLLDRDWVLTFVAWDLIWEALEPWIIDMRQKIGNPAIGHGLEWGYKMTKSNPAQYSPELVPPS